MIPLPAEPSPRTHRPIAIRGTALALRVAGFAGLAFAALLVALAATPAVPVTVFGQTVQVGAVAPSPEMGWSGPGQADLFGQGPVQTVQRFQGPVRPRVVWERFNRDAEASAFIQVTTVEGRRRITTGAPAVGAALAEAWTQYFVRLVSVAGLAGTLGHLLAVAVTAIVRGPHARVRHAPHRVWPLALSASLSMAVTAGAALLTVSSAREHLAGVSTLADLTGTASLVPAPIAAGPERADVEVAVIGDSTAAGVGNTAIDRPSDADIACARSADAYAEVLQSATGWVVENLACASATIPEGLLGPQPRRPVTPPAQVGVLKSMPGLRVVVVSVGANDIGWSDLITYCYGMPRCDDRASERLLQRRLDSFRLHYAQLLQQLSDLPSRPEVIVTGYYDPFGAAFDCPALRDPEVAQDAPVGYGFAPDETRDLDEVLRQKVDPLRSAVAQLNMVLQQGADAFGFAHVQPSFEGHALCSAQPWVQGLSDPYPFHPNAAGELAIAAAQLPELVALMPSRVERR